MAKVVAPKKEKLAAAEAEYSELMPGLNQKKAELAAVEANLAALNAKLKEMQVGFAVCCIVSNPCLTIHDHFCNACMHRSVTYLALLWPSLKAQQGGAAFVPS